MSDQTKPPSFGNYGGPIIIGATIDNNSSGGGFSSAPSHTWVPTNSLRLRRLLSPTGDVLSITLQRRWRTTDNLQDDWWDLPTVDEVIS